MLLAGFAVVLFSKCCADKALGEQLVGNSRGLGVPIWGAVVLRHEKGLSTTFKPQGSTIVGFFENRQAVYLRFCFRTFQHGLGSPR